jgi:hypothetical protein
MNVKKLMVFPLALLIFAWGAQGFSPALAQESGQEAQVAPAAGQPEQESVAVPAAPQAEERAPMEKVGHAGASFGKGTGNFFAKFGKGTGRFFKNAGVGTGRFFKRTFAGE